MLIYYDDLAEYVEISKQDWKALPRLLTRKSFESVARDDGGIDVDILSNRFPDAANFYGLAREVGVLLNKKTRIPKTSFDETDQPVRSFISVAVQTDLAPYYFGRAIRSVTQKPLPDIAKTLARYGMNATLPLVDLSNFVMLELGEPTHIFDLDKIQGKKIVVRMARKGERFTALDGRELQLDERSVVIADEAGPVALAGIIGGARTAVSQNTRNIFIEAAVFDQKAIYQTQRRLGVITEASRRFEKNLSPHRASHALQRLTALIQDRCGDGVLAGVVSNQKLQPPEKIVYDPAQLAGYSGVTVPLSTAKKILISLGCVLESWKNVLLVTPTADRQDIRIPEDLTEEVLRIVGYDAIKPVLTRRTGFAREDDLLAFGDLVRSILSGMPFFEVMNYEFVSQKDLALIRHTPIRIANPMSDLYQYFRPTMLCGMMSDLKDREERSAQCYEIGHVAYAENKKVVERDMLGVAVLRDSSQDALLAGKGFLEVFFDRLGIDDAEFDETESRHRDSADVQGVKKEAYRAWSALKEDGDAFGVCGIIADSVLRSHGVKGSLFFAEIDLRALSAKQDEEREFREPPKYPAVVRDVSFFASSYRKIDELEEALYGASALIENVHLTDVFQKNGKTSYTFRLTFRSEEKTLTSQEVDDELKNVTKAIRDLGGEIR